MQSLVPSSGALPRAQGLHRRETAAAVLNHQVEEPRGSSVVHPAGKSLPLWGRSCPCAAGPLKRRPQGTPRALLVRGSCTSPRALAWKPKDSTNVRGRAKTLLRKLRETNGSREEVVAALDSWAAFQQTFPLLATKCAIEDLQKQENWERVVQVCKWMLEKGHGDTYGTFSSLLEALAKLERDEEMDKLWHFLFDKNLDATPRSLLTRVLQLYTERKRPLKVIEVFGSMDELGMRLDENIFDLVMGALKDVGASKTASALTEEYSKVRVEWRYSSGVRHQVRSFGVERDAPTLTNHAGTWSQSEELGVERDAPLALSS